MGCMRFTRVHQQAEALYTSSPAGCMRFTQVHQQAACALHKFTSRLQALYTSSPAGCTCFTRVHQQAASALYKFTSRPKRFTQVHLKAAVHQIQPTF
ncbi:hypothetical protein ElyMa_001811600 [Elysia marginata]|uniref:Uncharacterized protein n=1 Tax=Elysia marginata TaxID=1093978 RepID=A0AAV4EHD0_9GAST|nr:hypothetical protein ElyMa_001811600 [Elysia marginata]